MMQNIRRALLLLVFFSCFFFFGIATAQESNVIARFTVHVVAGGDTAKFPRVELLNGKRITQLAPRATGTNCIDASGNNYFVAI
jgi:hypothetical protein